jgi:hypothetical protein
MDQLHVSGLDIQAVRRRSLAEHSAKQRARVIAEYDALIAIWERDGKDTTELRTLRDTLSEPSAFEAENLKLAE